MKKTCFTKKSCCSKQNRQLSLFLSKTCFGTEFREFVSIFFPRNGIPSIFLLCGTVRNRIPRVFCSAEWFNTEFREIASIFLPWYRIPSILLLCGTVRNGIPRVSVPRNSRNSAGTNLSEIANTKTETFYRCAFPHQADFRTNSDHDPFPYGRKSFPQSTYI
jgi:hypothetical protein